MTGTKLMTHLVSHVINEEPIVSSARSGRPLGFQAGHAGAAEHCHTGGSRKHVAEVIVGVTNKAVGHQLVLVEVVIAIDERVTVFVRPVDAPVQAALVHQLLVARDELQPGGDLGHVDP